MNYYLKARRLDADNSVALRVVEKI